MILETFRIHDFRSINDSGDIELEQITAMLGRNESGKSNLLLALRTLNPVEGFQALNPTKDFPRHRRLDECTPDTKVVTSMWTLSESESNELQAIYPRAANVRRVTVGRPYKKHRSVEFGGLPPIQFDKTGVQANITAIADAARAAANSHEGEQQTAVHKAIEAIVTVSVDDRDAWASDAQPHLAGLGKMLGKLKIDIDVEHKSQLDLLQRLAQTIAEDKPARQAAEEWVLSKLPVFIFLDEYPELDGYQNIQQYNHRKDHNQLTEADHNFERLCKVAGLDPRQLHKLQGESKHEERNQLANRASAVVTAEIRRLWRDRQLKVRFNFDGEHFATFVSDPTNTFDALVLLDDEPHARGVQSEMLTSKLLRDQQLICVSEAFEGTKPAEADIEDLIDPKIYEELSREAYAKELAGKELKFNANIPRIVKRLEAAFKEAGLTFNKTRPAGLFYRKIAVNASLVMTDASAKKFERLFAIIKERLEKLVARGSDPFH